MHQPCSVQRNRPSRFDSEHAVWIAEPIGVFGLQAHGLENDDINHNNWRLQQYYNTIVLTVFITKDFYHYPEKDFLRT